MKISRNFSWRKFIGGHDLIWNSVPGAWYEAPFAGNGFFGATYYFDKKNLRKLIISLGHTCVYDNRESTDGNDDILFAVPRLPIGSVEVEFKGKILDVNLRLDLYNARLFGTVRTSCGRAELNSLIFNDADCLVFEHAEHGGEELTFKYVPSHGMSPRRFGMLKDGMALPADYGDPRQPFSCTEHGVSAFTQPYYNGGGFCVACAEYGGRFFAGVKYSDKEEEKLASAAVSLVGKTAEEFDDLLDLHIDYWNSYYKRSFVSVGNGIYDGFLYIQLYKLACAGRENGRPFDTCGPWLTETTRWPGAWWNLNVQLTASPLYASNHIDIARCVGGALKNGMKELIENVPEKYRADCAALGRCTGSTMRAPVAEPGTLDAPDGYREAGNLVWALLYCCNDYLFTGDTEILTDTVYPLLKRAVKFYSYFLYEEEGRLHLKATLSPEYPKSDSPDVNYDLQLLRWGCEKLVEITETLGVSDGDKAMWEDILRRLTDYPQSESNGLYIAAGTPYEESHRHYSHLLAFYPLHTLDENNPQDRKLVCKTIDCWQSRTQALQGYSHTGAASMYAMLGEGDRALAHLQRLWRGFITPNTMYKEGNNPVLETPPSAATAVLDMLLQSHRGFINFFPAVSGEWKNICFDGLLCFGGFEVGARLRDGKTEWIRVTSKLGKRCIVKTEFASERLFADCGYKALDGGKLEINISKGQTAVISCVPNPEAEPIKSKEKTLNCYGLNKRNLT